MKLLKMHCTFPYMKLKVTASQSGRNGFARYFNPIQDIGGKEWGNKKTPLMMICRWTSLMLQRQSENDQKRQCFCQIRDGKWRGVRPVFQICLFKASYTRDLFSQPIKWHYFTKKGSTRFFIFVLICTLDIKY